MPSPSDETSLAETGLQSGSGAHASQPSTGAASRPGWLSSSGPGPSGEEIAPGSLLAERYRILGLIGRGGMGEVYRAEDLRLGQTVALKFLPAAVAEDPQRLAQFHHEVRIARQVSHRNVCRVYDIGEDHGRVFLTMELIDGEDLARLLKRVGRFPEDRATEIARQICAGLAAAHDLGVLHRDLKPANVMLDADGRVRITDFGLAGLAGTFTDVRSGTPAYMAPEQLAGKDVTERSDIFSLGLVLFEIYTGRRAFDATTLAELLRQHDEGIRLSSAPSGPSLDPVVEQVILRCLAPDPVMRPASAIAVSAALPGGDPLAAALAAGETPSPAMVAAAGRVEPVPLTIGLSLLALVIVCLGGFIALRSANSFHRQVPLPLSSAVLEDRARQVLERFGYRDTPADAVGQVFVGEDYLVWARKQPPAGRWAALSTGRVPAIGFWYRTSPRLLIPRAEDRQPTLPDPPFRLVGMTATLVDSRGALIEFHAVPPQRTPAQSTPSQPAPIPPTPNVDWQIVFDAVGWPRDRFTPATPEWTPLVDTDLRAAWTGTLPELGTTPLRLEAGTFRGRLVFVQTVGPWTGASREAPPETKTFAQRMPDVFLALLILSLIVGSVLLARRNMVLGRGDQQGGWRVAAALAVLVVLRWAFWAHHVPDYPIEQDAILDAIGRGLLPAGIVWLAYLGIEPWIRRHWPASLISWSRMLTGAIRDPLVGRDVLIGLAFGVGTALIPTLSQQLLVLTGGVPAPDFNGVWALTTPRYVFASLIGGVSNALFNALLLMVLYVVLRRLLRRPWLAAVLVMALLALVIGAENGVDGRAALAVVVTMGVLMLLPLVRFGLLPFAVSFFSRQVLVDCTLTTDLGAWYATPTWIVGGTIVGLAIVAFKHSRAGVPTFGRLLEE
ncbi:MAG TPA: serine/threonine-protein kinase [Vicinamibacterales bacterium]|nr:serine/threonine-protein kinase [Vicinamibacterales bacterium]